MVVSRELSLCCFLFILVYINFTHRFPCSVKSKNGRVWWEGVSDEADEALAEVLAEDGENELRFVDFGTEGTYFLLHE